MSGSLLVLCPRIIFKVMVRDLKNNKTQVSELNLANLNITCAPQECSVVSGRVDDDVYL